MHLQRRVTTGNEVASLDVLKIFFIVAYTVCKTWNRQLVGETMHFKSTSTLTLKCCQQQNVELRYNSNFAKEDNMKFMEHSALFYVQNAILLKCEHLLPFLKCFSHENTKQIAQETSSLLLQMPTNIDIFSSLLWVGRTQILAVPEDCRYCQCYKYTFMEGANAFLQTYACSKKHQTFSI